MAYSIEVERLHLTKISWVSIGSPIGLGRLSLDVFITR